MVLGGLKYSARIPRAYRARDRARGPRAARARQFFPHEWDLWTGA